MAFGRINYVIFCIAAFASFLEQNARAETGKIITGYYDGELLEKRCLAKMGQDDHLLCEGYIAGGIDMIMELDRRLGAHTICPPRSLNLMNTNEFVAGWITLDPERRKLMAAANLIEALKQAFPCR